AASPMSAQPALQLRAPSPAPLHTQQNYMPAPPPPPTGPTGQWSGVGRLRPSHYRVDGLLAYALDASWGQTILYVTPEPGVDLTPFVGRTVDVHGAVVYRGDLRANHMTADYIVQAP